MRLTLFETSWEGSSAQRKASRKTVFPRLKSGEGEQLNFNSFIVNEGLVRTIGRHSQIWEEVVRIRLGEVVSVQVQGREGHRR